MSLENYLEFKASGFRAIFEFRNLGCTVGFSGFGLRALGFRV